MCSCKLVLSMIRYIRPTTGWIVCYNLKQVFQALETSTAFTDKHRGFKRLMCGVKRTSRPLKSHSCRISVDRKVQGSTQSFSERLWWLSMTGLVSRRHTLCVFCSDQISLNQRCVFDSISDCSLHIAVNGCSQKAAGRFVFPHPCSFHVDPGRRDQSTSNISNSCRPRVMIIHISRAGWFALDHSVLATFPPE